MAAVPPAVVPQGAAAPGQAVLSLSARYGKDLPTINGGLVWRIFSDRPDDTGTFKMIREDRNPTPNIVLSPGNYVVHVALGLVSAVRTPVGKAYKGTLRATRPDDLAAVAIKGALDRVPHLDPREIEDVILGCAMPEAEQGMNVARIASLRAGLPVECSAMTINRFCSSGLQAIAMSAERIMAGGAETIVAGGVE